MGVKHRVVWKRQGMQCVCVKHRVVDVSGPRTQFLYLKTRTVMYRTCKGGPCFRTKNTSFILKNSYYNVRNIQLETVKSLENCNFKHRVPIGTYKKTAMQFVHNTKTVSQFYLNQETFSFVSTTFEHRIPCILIGVFDAFQATCK